MFDFVDKNIILFSPFGSCIDYSIEIKSELERRGANVCLYDERPSQSVITKIYVNYFRKYFTSLFLKYIERVTDSCAYDKVDYIIVVRGQGFDESVLTYFRKRYQGAVIIFFQWDSLNSMNVPKVMDLYDRAFSFDPDDVINNKAFSFRPTFYLSRYRQLPTVESGCCDISFVGTLYKNRWPIIQRFKKEMDKNGYKSFFYLYLNGWIVYLFNRITSLHYAPMKMIHLSLLKGKDYTNLVANSKCILDINYSNQKGLSLRSYETLASGRKFITTNEDIKKYDFYNPNNILVVSADNPVIPKSFIESPFEPVDEKILYKYSVAGFVDELFEGM